MTAFSGCWNFSSTVRTLFLKVCGWLISAKLLRHWTPSGMSFNRNWWKQPLEEFCEKSVLRNFAKLTGKHLRETLFLIKLRRPWHGCFLVNFLTFLRAPFYIEHLRWLLLISVCSFVVKNPENGDGNKFSNFLKNKNLWQFNLRNKHKSI